MPASHSTADDSCRVCRPPHPLGVDEVQSRCCLTPQVLELQALWLQQGIDQIEDIEPDAATVDLSKNVAHLVEFEIPVELDVGNLELLGNAFKVLIEEARILAVLSCTRHIRVIPRG